MAEAKTNVMRILEKEHIPYQAHFYDPDGPLDGVSVAQSLGQNPARVFKTLVTRGAGRDFYVFVIPVDKELDLKKCARSVGEKAVEMIHVSEINKVTGYIRGGCSPFGMKKAFVTVFDVSALDGETMTVSAGRRGSQVEAAPRPLAALAGAKFEPVTAE